MASYDRYIHIGNWNFSFPSIESFWIDVFEKEV